MGWKSSKVYKENNRKRKIAKMIKDNIVNYLLVYWCFILNRSILERVYSDEITVVTGGLCIFLILLYGHKLKIYKSEIISFVLLNLFLSTLMLKTGLGYNYTSFININVFFVYTYLTLKIIGDKKKLYAYVINIAVVLSVISLVCFVIEQLGLTQLYNWVPEFMSGNYYASTKGGFLYAFNYQHATRNCGIW